MRILLNRAVCIFSMVRWSKGLAQKNDRTSDERFAARRERGLSAQASWRTQGAIVSHNRRENAGIFAP